MCGICGVVLPSDSDPRGLEGRIRSMIATLEHRGPDASGVWVSGNVPVALGHARLAVVDVSPAGAQPMTSPDNRWIISYNGEIYNAAVLRRTLSAQGVSFRGSSDTEVLLGALSTWGLREALERIDGMFAFAAFDAQAGELHLVRDRMGEKPLYFGLNGSAFLFGSELKALRAYPDFSGTIDREALEQMLLSGYVPGPLSIFEGISKLQPGHGVTYATTGLMEMWKYWDVRAIAVGRSSTRIRPLGPQLVDQADRLLSDVVSRELVADVPLGALLSGGIDSSLVVALAQKSSAAPLRTFTVGFSEPEYDESAYARMVSRHLGTEHTEVIVTPKDAMAVIPDLPSIYDEPFGDSSQIPTVLISRIARRSVTVALTGDGGDELFGGYQRYGVHSSLGRLAALPLPMRRRAARLISVVPDDTWQSLGRTALGRRLPGGSHRLGERVHKASILLSTPDLDQSAYAALMVQALPAGGHLVSGSTSQTPFVTTGVWDPRLDRLGRMRLVDQSIYLPDDLLVKVDRAAMSASLETRAPLLSREVVEFAWGLPSDRLRRRGQGKWLLRQVLRRYVPSEMFERPKMGFGVPVGQWLRGPLRPWAEDLISSLRTDTDQLIDGTYASDIWRAHADGFADHGYLMWHILMFQAWREASS